jgi:uncharacterized protein
MRRCGAILGVLLVASLVCSTVAGAGEAKRIRWTAQEVGTFIMMASTTLSEISKRYLPKDVQVDVLPYGAVVASVTLVEDGKAEIGWANVTALWAQQGKFMYTKPHTHLTAIAGTFEPSSLQIFARKEFVTKTGLKTINDIREKKLGVRIATKTKGSLGQLSGPLQLEAHGITYDDIKAWGGTVTETSVGDIVARMKDARADLWFDNLAPGHPSVTEYLQTADGVVIPPTPEAVKYLEKYGFYPFTLKAGSWKGQEVDMVQVSGPTLLIARKDVPDEIVYAITKAICENADEVRKAHAQMKVFDEKIAWRKDKVVIDLHPGAKKYYVEKGWMQ